MISIQELKKLAAKTKNQKLLTWNEDKTKNALILPFLKCLGYNPFDTDEVDPEYKADFSKGGKKSDQVDYAIIIDNQPQILIEAKKVSESLKEHTGQLARYYAATDAKYAILTNGIIYEFYSDFDKINVMDSDPFMVFDLLNITEESLNYLEMFCKNGFDAANINAEFLAINRVNAIKTRIENDLNNPSDEYVKYLMKNVFKEFSGKKRIVEEYRIAVNKAGSLLLSGRKCSESKEKSPIGKNTTKTSGSVSYDEQEYLNQFPEKAVDLYNKYKAKICSDKSRIQIRVTKVYVNLVKDKTIMGSLVPGNNLYLIVKSSLGPKGIDTKQSFIRDVSKIGHWGVGDLEITIDDNADKETKQKVDAFIDAYFSLT